jgi:hypothetical protein
LVPSYIVTAINKMVRSRDATIRVERLLSDAEAEQREVMMNPELERHKTDKRPHKPQYVSEDVGTLDGLASLYAENDLRELIVVDLLPQLETLKTLDLEIRDLELGRWVTWIAGIDEKIDRVKSAIRAGSIAGAAHLNQLKLARDGETNAHHGIRGTWHHQGIFHDQSPYCRRTHGLRLVLARRKRTEGRAVQGRDRAHCRSRIAAGRFFSRQSGHGAAPGRLLLVQVQ